MAKRSWWQQAFVFVGVLVVLYFSRTFLNRNPDGKGDQKVAENGASKLPAIAERGDEIIEQAYRAKRSKVWVESVSKVIKLLRDDDVGARHQLFLVKLRNGLTLKVSHNLDLAPRVPVKVGDMLHMRGRYEYNDKGGVLHWTHHDPRNRGPGGWIKREGKVYK